MVIIHWEQVPGEEWDPAIPLDLGTISSLPGGTQEMELRAYFTGEASKLINLRLYLSTYADPYPHTTSTALEDFWELRHWGDLVGDNSVGFRLNLNKQNNFPTNSWQQISSLQGWHAYNAILVPKTAIRLGDGSYHTVDGELPSGAAMHVKVQVVAPLGTERLGRRYFSFILDYEVVQ